MRAVGAIRTNERALDQASRAIRLSCLPGRLGGGREPTAQRSRVVGELCRALERSRGRSMAAAKLRALPRRLERGCDVFVSGQRRERLMPDATVGVLVSVERVG